MNCQKKNTIHSMQKACQSEPEGPHRFQFYHPQQHPSAPKLTSFS